MKPELLISALAIAVAVASFWHNRRSTIASIRPILVFLYDNERGWHARNVGDGPALNVIIAKRQPTGSWIQPVRVPPIDSGDFFLLFWALHDNAHQLGAMYEDFQGRIYSSICARDLTTLSRGRKLPSWSESDIQAHWKLRKGSVLTNIPIIPSRSACCLPAVGVPTTMSSWFPSLLSRTL